MEVCLRRKPAAQALSFGPDRDAGRPERPGIEDEIIEDEAFAVARLHTDFCCSGHRRWHIGDLDFVFHALADFERHPVEGRDQQPVMLDGFWRCLLRDLRIGPHGRRHPRLKAMLFVEKSADRLRILRTRLIEVEILRVDRIGVKRDQERGIAPKHASTADALAPECNVHLRGHPEKLLREAGPGIERGPHFPIQPADVVLLGSEANLVVGCWRREVLVAPRARHLARKPGMARLWNGDRVEAVLAKQHGSL